VTTTPDAMTMTTPVRVLERLTLTAPLGVIFHDAATGSRVGAGLDVSIYPRSNTSARAQMFPNPSGIYVLNRAPKLARAFAFGAGDEAFWSSQPTPQTYVMEVVDLTRRFQPFSLEIDLPVRGIYNWVSPLEPSTPTSPPSASNAPASIPLYSAPARTLPPGMAVVRADLRDASDEAKRDVPAAWAVVEARYEGHLIARGLADARGSLALIFPYPAPPTFTVASPVDSPPSSSHSLPLFEQKWDVTINAAYAGTASSASSVATTPAAIPDLRSTLEQLNAPRARLWADAVGGAELSVVTLEYGRELVLKTQHAVSSSPPASQSALLITPAGSPP
jgi:hypothetical protein